MPLAIVGMGATSVSGLGVDALWRSCLEGGANFAPIRHFPAAGGHLAGFAPVSPGGPGHADPGRFGYLLRTAIEEAVAEAPPPPAGAGTCVLVATTTTAPHQDRFHGAALGPSVLDDVTATLAALGIEARVSVIGNASGSGTVALAVARDLLLAGAASRVLVCGVDLITESAFAGLMALRTLSDRGCRPFDAERGGIRVAECGAVIVLDQVDRTDRPVLAGAAISNKASQMVRPEAAAVARAVADALADADMSPADIGYVNAHAAGTRQGDHAELLALTDVFGERLPGTPISSVKGALGHAQGAAGVLEAIVTAKALVHRVCPPTLGLRRPDPLWAALDLGVRPQAMPRPAAVTISCGLGGTNAAAVITVGGQPCP